MRRRLRHAGAAVAVALAAAAPAEARVRLVAGPQHAARNAPIAVSWAVPAPESLRPAGRQRFVRRAYAVVLRADHPRAGCVAHAAAAPERFFANRDELRATVRGADILSEHFEPALAGSPYAEEWCTGHWRGGLFLRRDVCTVPAGGLGECVPGRLVLQRWFGLRVAARSERGCRVPVSKTITASPAARIYSMGDTAWGCLRATGRRWLLATGLVGDDAMGAIVLAGPYVAFAAHPGDPCQADGECGPDDDPSPPYLGVVDLRSGAGRHFDGRAPVGDDVALSRSGAVAWVTTGAGGTLEVDADDVFGFRVLDPGPVEPGSLRLAGATVGWAARGARHHALLR